jgi:hypothetical protein
VVVHLQLEEVAVLAVLQVVEMLVELMVVVQEQQLLAQAVVAVVFVMPTMFL